MEEAMPSKLERLQRASAKARDRYWATVGTVDPDVVGQFIASRFMPGVPRWPSGRERFRVVRREDKDTIVIATDGLSDPDDGEYKNRNGHGVELFIEASDMILDSLDSKHLDILSRAVCNVRPIGSTHLDILTQVARNVAYAGQIFENWQKYQLLSMEVPAARNEQDQDLANSGGFHVVLLGMPGFDVAPEIGDMPLSPVKAMAVTVVHPDDFEKIRSDGSAGRARLARALTQCGHGHVSDMRRTPVL